MKIEVAACFGWNGSSTGWLSRTRAEVVPTAMMRRRSALARLSAAAAAGGIW